ncbi:MAG TPA: ABC transporter permease [Nocardioidaceae bacterium]|nr:ABC transporter permease [Nocardioidaceae bacterium]
MTSSTVSARRPARAAVAKVPLSRHVRVELRKLTDTRAGMWLLIAIALLTVAAVTLFLVFGPRRELTYNNFVGITLTPQGFLLPVLGILAVTSEWSQRTGLVTFTLEPVRSRIVVSKLIAVTILALTAVALLLLVAALGNVLGASWQDGDGSWSFGVEGLRDVTLLQLMGIIQGVAFGMILLNSAAAIVLAFVIPIGFSIVFTLVSSLRDIAPWIDLATAQTPLFDHTMRGDDWLKLAVASLLWIAVPLVAGIVRVLRSEVKSA